MPMGNVRKARPDKGMAQNYRKPKSAAINPRPRLCLMCGDVFQSEGIHNRICQKCRNSQLWRDGC